MVTYEDRNKLSDVVIEIDQMFKKKNMKAKADELEMNLHKDSRGWLYLVLKKEDEDWSNGFFCKVKIPSIDKLFDVDSYEWLDRRAKIYEIASTLSPLELAKVRVMRMAFDAVSEIANNWNAFPGRYSYLSVAENGTYTFYPEGTY